jgi:hypothetical protein
MSSAKSNPAEVKLVFFEFNDNAEYLSDSSGSDGSDLENEIEVSDDLRSEDFSINNESSNASERKSELLPRSLRLDSSILLKSNSEVSSSKS